ncbi:MAG: alpha/beta hydrolase [Pseudomonadota bacterium]
MNQVPPTKVKPRSISIGDGSDTRAIALLRQEGDPAKHGLFWLSGFKSSMMGEKATAIAAWATEANHTFTRFDYSGHGLSGGAFEEGTISRWLGEALAVFTSETTGPQVMIGSSMGGWIALLLARALQDKERLRGMVLIAPAWDMTERLMWARFPHAIKSEIRDKGFFERPSAYGDGPYTITNTLIEDGKRHLIGDDSFQVGCPIHILHGREDVDVPYGHGQDLLTRLPFDDVRFTLVPDGDHRLSRPQDLDLMLQAIQGITEAD